MTVQEFYLLYEAKLPPEGQRALSDADKGDLLRLLRQSKRKAARA